ncbi:MAG TPA: DUF3035 domain-containing protein [Candidatus Omnitrophota bacterium]|nr:DUF3035 domain-containing protein [Candidatus Omnitrophota bacterium]
MTIRIATPHALRAVASAAILVLGLSGCSDVKRAIGFEKAPPDEFQVVERAPLAMPPDFSLRPPAPGAVRPQEGSTRDQARQALLGRTAQISTQGRTQGDMALLKKAGAENAQADIRILVNKETQSLAEADKSFTDKLVFWSKSAPYGEALDPAKEAQRLRENQALGKAVTDGETPVIKRRKRGMLEGVFD